MHLRCRRCRLKKNMHHAQERNRLPNSFVVNDQKVYKLEALFPFFLNGETG